MTASVSGPAGSVFISYRREDSGYAASFLFNLLVPHFGINRVFWDENSIQPGDDFTEAIQAAVGACSVLLAFIGPQWLAAEGDAGRRLDDPQDWVRLEIEAGLTRSVRVIPVLINGARMPATTEVPSSLARLAHLEAFELRAGHFEWDAGRLIASLEATIPAKAAVSLSGPLTGPLPMPLAPDERPVITVSKHPAVLIGPVMAVILALSVAGFLTTHTFMKHSGGGIAIIWVLWLAVAAWSATKVIAWARDYLVVTSERKLYISEAPWRRVTIPLSKVTNLRLRKPLVGRFLGYGDIIIETAGQEVSLRRVDHLPYPEQVILEIVGFIFRGE